MLIYDIVRTIKSNIPFYSERFTDIFNILSFSYDSLNRKYTIQTSPLPIGSPIKPISATNNEVTIGGVLLKNNVLSVDYQLTGSAIIEFENPHFITMNVGCERYFNQKYKYYRNPLVLDVQIKLDGNSDIEWNNNFIVCSVPDSKRVEILFIDIPLDKTPSVLNYFQEDIDNPIFNVLSTINYLSPNNFEITLSENAFPFSGWAVDGSNAKIYANHRITGSLNLETASAAYTKQNPEALYIFVTKGDSSGENTFASQSRYSNLDSTDIRTTNVYYQQNIIERFTVNLFVPSTYSIAGRQSIDTSELMKPILFKSILGKKFPSLYKQGIAGNVTYISDSYQAYNSAYYVHGYFFERIDSINIDDCVDREYNYPIDYINLDYINKSNNDIILTDHIDLTEDKQ